MTKWKVKRWEQIYRAVAAAGGAGMTRKEIAEALGLRKSNYLVEMLRSQVAQGWLTETFDDDRPHPSFIYRAAAVEAAA